MGCDNICTCGDQDCWPDKYRLPGVLLRDEHGKLLPIWVGDRYLPVSDG